VRIIQRTRVQERFVWAVILPHGVTFSIGRPSALQAIGSEDFHRAMTREPYGMSGFRCGALLRHPRMSPLVMTAFVGLSVIFPSIRL
jgi:hypothetical protein